MKLKTKLLTALIALVSFTTLPMSASVMHSAIDVEKFVYDYAESVMILNMLNNHYEDTLHTKKLDEVRDTKNLEEASSSMNTIFNNLNPENPAVKRAHGFINLDKNNVSQSEEFETHVKNQELEHLKHLKELGLPGSCAIGYDRHYRHKYFLFCLSSGDTKAMYLTYLEHYYKVTGKWVQYLQNVEDSTFYDESEFNFGVAQ